MGQESLIHMTIQELAPRIKAREVMPVEVTEAALARRSGYSPCSTPYITMLPEQARAQAKARETAIAKGTTGSHWTACPSGFS